MAAREFFNISGRTTTAPATTQHKAWHSPVPFLFGGLAAMFGLIAIALIILACSFLKLSSNLETGGDQRDRHDLEAGDGNKARNSDKQPAVTDEKILVIMAGDAKPTFLATPMSTSSSNLITNNYGTSLKCSCTEKSEKP